MIDQFNCRSSFTVFVLVAKCGQMTVSRDTNKQHNITQSVGDMFCVMNSSALQPPVPLLMALHPPSLRLHSMFYPRCWLLPVPVIWSQIVRICRPHDVTIYTYLPSTTYHLLHMTISRSVQKY